MPLEIYRWLRLQSASLHEQTGETINSQSAESEGHVEKCRHFMRTGQCDFGDKCRFSHEKVVTGYYTPHSIRANWRRGRDLRGPKGLMGHRGSKNLGYWGIYIAPHGAPLYIETHMDSHYILYHMGGTLYILGPTWAPTIY